MGVNTKVPKPEIEGAVKPSFHCHKCGKTGKHWITTAPIEVHAKANTEGAKDVKIEITSLRIHAKAVCRFCGESLFDIYGWIAEQLPF